MNHIANLNELNSGYHLSIELSGLVSIQISNSDTLILEYYNREPQTYKISKTEAIIECYHFLTNKLDEYRTAVLDIDVREGKLNDMIELLSGTIISMNEKYDTLNEDLHKKVSNITYTMEKSHNDMLFEVKAQLYNKAEESMNRCLTPVRKEIQEFKKDLTQMHLRLNRPPTYIIEKDYKESDDHE